MDTPGIPYATTSAQGAHHAQLIRDRTRITTTQSPAPVGPNHPAHDGVKAMRWGPLMGQIGNYHKSTEPGKFRVYNAMYAAAIAYMEVNFPEELKKHREQNAPEVPDAGGTRQTALDRAIDTFIKAKGWTNPPVSDDVVPGIINAILDLRPHMPRGDTAFTYANDPVVQQNPPPQMPGLVPIANVPLANVPLGALPGFAPNTLVPVDIPQVRASDKLIGLVADIQNPSLWNRTWSSGHKYDLSIRKLKNHLGRPETPQNTFRQRRPEREYALVHLARILIRQPGNNQPPVLGITNPAAVHQSLRVIARHVAPPAATATGIAHVPAWVTRLDGNAGNPQEILSEAKRTTLLAHLLKGSHLMGDFSANMVMEMAMDNFWDGRKVGSVELRIKLFAAMVEAVARNLARATPRDVFRLPIQRTQFQTMLRQNVRNLQLIDASEQLNWQDHFSAVTELHAAYSLLAQQQIPEGAAQTRTLTDAIRAILNELTRANRAEVDPSPNYADDGHMEFDNIFGLVLPVTGPRPQYCNPPDYDPGTHSEQVDLSVIADLDLDYLAENDLL